MGMIVQTSSFDAIFSKLPIPNVIHYMSLDTEGTEYDILLQFPFDKYRVLAITVETGTPKLEPKRSQIQSLLESHGFFLDVRVEHDEFYLQTGYEAHLPAPIKDYQHAVES